MKLNEAIVNRIFYYITERDITINKLATMSLLTQSTLNNIVNNHTKDIKLLTVLKICEGLDISLTEFFNDDMFLNIDIDF